MVWGGVEKEEPIEGVGPEGEDEADHQHLRHPHPRLGGTSTWTQMLFSLIGDCPRDNLLTKIT